jgi:adenylate kinase family enzyme
MIIGMAGLPGTGKTTLAVELAQHLNPAPLLLSKDLLRHALFGPDHTHYTREQDDFCIDKLLDTAVWQWRHSPATTVILDGRTWSQTYQLHRLRTFATHQRQHLLLIECVCNTALALARLTRDHARGDHPAGNRTPELHHQLAAAADPISGPKLVLNTEQPVTVNIETILHHLPAGPIRTIAPPRATVPSDAVEVS